MIQKTKAKLALAGGPAIVAVTFFNSGFAKADCSTDAVGVQQGANCAQGVGQPSNLQTSITTITNTLLLIVGITAVIMLIIGGFQYIFSTGSQDRVASAKNTILFSIIGIVVALLAYAIVNFVVGRFGS